MDSISPATRALPRRSRSEPRRDMTAPARPGDTRSIIERGPGAEKRRRTVTQGFETLGFHDFHRLELPRRLSEGPFRSTILLSFAPQLFPAFLDARPNLLGPRHLRFGFGVPAAIRFCG